MDEIVAIDIGSTKTKGALFRCNDGELRLLGREEENTSVENLEEGFFSIYDSLCSKSSGKPKLVYSSSAKGGLSICAIGIVPNLTLKIAQETALSAGARITSHFAYKLTGEDIGKIESGNPDILLLSGGTDGGNEEFLLHNAALLAESCWKGPILFAGNRSVAGEIAKRLRGKELYISENILPEMERPNIEPARREIGRLFLQRLCTGKGLESIITRSGTAPVPTPAALFDFLSLPGFRTGISNRDTAGGFLLFDIGGATSDCYLRGTSALPTDRIVKGLPEADPKRSVEGDLGLRVSASAAIAAAESHPFFVTDPICKPGDMRELRRYGEAVSRRPETPPGELDRVLAQICITLSLFRHAGRIKERATSSGSVLVQEGKDLSRIKTVIVTGGYLSRCDPLPTLPDPPLIDEQGRELLIPNQPFYWQDSDYLWPLLANAARLKPEAACALAPEVLKKRSNHES